MDKKIFLGKYRVSGDEIDAVGESAGGPLAYEAQKIDSGRKVVVELVPAGGLKVTERERLEAEATAAKTLHHPNIPILYDFGIEDDHLVYVTEDFDGTLAEEWVNAHGPLPVGSVLRVASQVVSALGAAALYQIVHHAINPSNLVLVAGQTAEGEWPMVKVLHLGGIPPTLSDNGGTVAAFDKSLHYVSPEQIQKGTVNFRSAIYSLGCTMWFLLTGVPPLLAANGSTAMPPATARGKIRAVPRKVRSLLAQVLSPNPAARPSDPLEFYGKLQDCLVRVERQEARSFRLVEPSFPGTSIDMPARQSTLRALAFAALFLALAAIAALAISGYVRHRRVVRAEEPIGVPVGVPGSVASATPAPANEGNAIASNSQTTSTLARGSSSQSAPAQGPGTVTTSTTPLDAASGVASNSAQTTNPVVQSNHPQSAPVEQGTVTSVTPAASNATTAVASNSTNTANTAAQPGYTGSPPAEASRNVASGTPGMADTTNAIASNSTESATTVDPANPPSAPKSAEESKSTNALRRATDAAPKTVQNRGAVSPGRFPNAESLPNQQPEQATAAAGNPKTSTETASGANAGTNRTPTQSSDSVAQQPARKKFALHEVRRAEPVEPEARSAEAVSPEEGPGTSAPEKTTSSQPRTNSRAQVEAGRDVETETGENTARSGKPSDSEPKVATRPRTKPERPAKSKRQMDDGIYPPQPMPESAGPLPHATRKPFRARFIGVTPDGMWMFRLPSNRIVIVPPPDR